MENMYNDEKWKLSKKGSCRNHSRSKRERTTASSSSSSTSGSGGAHQYLKRSASMPESVKAARRPPPPSSSSSSSSGSGSSPRSSFTSRCTNLVKEQRAKFYIMRRCVTMLMCWRDYP